MVPIIGLDNSDLGAAINQDDDWKASVLGGSDAFAATQPERLVKAISSELGITDCKLTIRSHVPMLMPTQTPPS
jgi:aminopeptidase I